MPEPKVSILLPNLNKKQFLVERLETILNQTFTDWELIAVDSYSDDGSWEILQEYAIKEPRMSIYQVPKGLYQSWNLAIELSRGEYIYIATSDDTMTPDCLEKMVNALEQHPECDLCDCNIEYIDVSGQKIPEIFPTERYFGDLMQKTHIRRAPHDGILHCGFASVYISITQLLIRKTLFDKIGLFPTNRGTKGDFEWKMRASLVANTIHIPYTLATWRRYDNQATPMMVIDSLEFYKDLIDIVKTALSTLENHDPDFYRVIDSDRLQFIYRDIQIKDLRIKYNNRITRFKIVLPLLLSNPRFALDFLRRKIVGEKKCFYTMIREELKRLKLDNSIEIIE